MLTVNCPGVGLPSVVLGVVATMLTIDVEASVIVPMPCPDRKSVV